MKKTRQEKILALLNTSENKSLSTMELSKKLNVTPMTIRRDLNDLSKRKLLTRSYGGASIIIEKSTNEKLMIQRHAKLEIGAKIAEMITENSTIYLGAGTTIAAATQFLPLNQGVQYVTNSDLIFRQLIKKNADLTLTGGNYNKSASQFLGTIAIQCLENYYFDQVFVSANGIFQGKATTSSFPDVNIKKAALKQAKKKYIVLDSKKLGLADPYLFSNIEDIDGVIIDSKIKSYQVRELEKYTHVIICKSLPIQKKDNPLN